MNNHNFDNDFSVYVGIDDTDSASGMCTTYICCVIMDRLISCGFRVDGPPRLIRLNPFAPHKTRGNGAVSFKIVLKSKKEVEQAKKIIRDMVGNLAVMGDPKTNPGLVFYEGKITPELQDYAIRTIRTIVSQEEAEKLAGNLGADIFKYKKGRGVIGSLAAIGCPLTDATYELLAYREPANYGKKRMVDEDSVLGMNQKTYPNTFDNVDDGYMTITPHTPCPVLYGIRGETMGAVEEAHKLVKVSEPIEFFRVFLTNQHTDMHLQNIDAISNMKQFQCYIVPGTVRTQPVVIEGGHVIFVLEDESGEVECAAYEPTKKFRDVVRHLAPGDQVIVYGGIGNKGTLNVEKIKITSLAPVYEYLNPICDCGKRMKSAGKGKGYKCPRCGSKMPTGSEEDVEVREKREIERMIKPGFYEVPPSARRHLSKPLVRG
ncbi:DNA-binding protein [Methanobacterium subterraneum]|uniref:tRNA(Ile2) 2-agmatinylcytidine synthetase TiaS n=2 Tax=Methanobacterium subterraneum TaxID=59277 RepID=A0A2H4VC84_9EURY|nr:tRNA(Ile)(2)-agmatinylcytidine synthase [Methanobacterium subterraneum]AUB55697.1 DNA-binding protein [Methanobacterium subterraneum]AUB60440.1 DNA-binding protein [Methanobacterium subterraneum]PKL71817.1 MAG: DNA-binding protein [Methanobacteriales archaeon HGW-Methanobacteriales-2]